jgi:hypothetical protein
MADPIEGTGGGLGLGLTPAQDDEVIAVIGQTTGFKIFSTAMESRKEDDQDEE